MFAKIALRLPAYTLAQLERQHRQTSFSYQIDELFDAFSKKNATIKEYLKARIILNTRGSLAHCAQPMYETYQLERLLTTLNTLSAALGRTRQATERGRFRQALGTMCNDVWPLVLKVEEQIAPHIDQRGVLLPEFGALFELLRTRNKNREANHHHAVITLLPNRNKSTQQGEEQ